MTWKYYLFKMSAVIIGLTLGSLGVILYTIHDNQNCHMNGEVRICIKGNLEGVSIE